MITKYSEIKTNAAPVAYVLKSSKKIEIYVGSREGNKTLASPHIFGYSCSVGIIISAFLTAGFYAQSGCCPRPMDLGMYLKWSIEVRR
jgi:hypothetical protein